METESQGELFFGGRGRPELRLAHWEGLWGREALLFQPGGILRTQASTEETGETEREHLQTPGPLKTPL